MIRLFSLRLALPLALVSLTFVLAIDRATTPIVIERFGDSFTIQISGFPGKHYRIEASNDLEHWASLAILQGLGPLTQSVPGTEHNARFVRAVEITGSAGMTGEVMTTTNLGDAVLRPINHASFVVHWHGVTIYNDPVGSTSAYRGLPSPDLILVSHQHGDHFSSDTITDLRSENTVIITPPSVFAQLPDALKEITSVLANGESLELLDLTVDALPAYNDRHPKGRDNGYILTLGDKRIYLSGDTEDIPEMRALEGIEVAFVSMNVPFTMSVDQAASALLDFQPRKVYPYHYRNSGGSFADLTKLKSHLSQAPAIEVRTADWY